MQTWQRRAELALADLKLNFDLPMSQVTTFKIGGPLDLLVEVVDLNQLKKTLDFCVTENLPWQVLGLGSNLLVRDKGIRGVAIKLTGAFQEWRVDRNTVTAGTGVSLAELAKGTAGVGLSGLEFACGIPGTVGGAIFMNAGAYDGEISQVVTRVEAYHAKAGLQTYQKDELKLGYRKSCFQGEPIVITKAFFQLQLSSPEIALAKIANLTCRREDKQPLDCPSAGSVFRRPPGYFVGTLIQEAGLKGYRIGGAQVSPKHAGFIINTGGATARDVLNLIAHIQKVIKERNGVDLIPEIRVIGEE